jgi:amidohydrolase
MGAWLRAQGLRSLPTQTASMQELASQTIERVVHLRRAIHQHPELGFEEFETQALIERELDAIGIEHRRLAGTGVVGFVRGALAGKTAALRADMDALPLTERTGLPFASQIAGKMHACGHDAHTAMLLGAARELHAMRERLHGTTVLIFQPAEEGPGGAQPMVEQGVLDDPKVDAIAMLHVDPRLAPGEISITPGPVNASADELYLTIRGKGGHGAYPHTAVDAIPAASAVVLALQTIAARETDPLQSVVVTIGTISGGYRNNIIADEVQMSGTLRAFDPQIRDGLSARVHRIVEHAAAAYGATAEIRIVRGYPPVINDVPLAEGLASYMRAHTSIAVHRLPATMGGEDFAYFAQRVPGVHVRLGIRSEAAQSTYPGHSPEFRIDEEALPYGVRTLVAFAMGVGSGEI